MIALNLLEAAADARAANTARPATAIVHESDDARLVVFRLSPGQAVRPHRNSSTVMLTVLSGAGIVSGEDSERPVVRGDLVAFQPNELHGMRAMDGELVLLAVIAPRPGARGTEPTPATTP